MEPIDTGCKDKTGRTIYVGDILQIRLGTFSKSGGAQTVRVFEYGKKFHVVAESQTDTKYGGTELTHTLCQNLVVIKTLR